MNSRSNWVLVSSLVMVALLVAACNSGGGGAEPETVTRQPPTMVASSPDQSSEPIGRIGDQTITQSDFEEYVAIVAGNREYMESEIGAGARDGEQLTALAALMDEWGTPTVALAGLIQDHALYQYALQQGYSVSDREVADEVAREREALARAPSTEAMPQGADDESFWREVYPSIIWRRLLLERFWADRLDFGASAAERAEVMARTEAEALNAIPVSLVDSADLDGATLEGARAYLDAYHALHMRSAGE